MRGLSSIVATAILLAITITGSLLIYSYVNRYLRGSASEDVIVEEAVLYRYSNSSGELYVTIFNPGLRDAQVSKVEVLSNGQVVSSTSVDVVVKAGSRTRVAIPVNPSGLYGSSIYVRIMYSGGQYSKPAEVTAW